MKTINLIAILVIFACNFQVAHSGVKELSEKGKKYALIIGLSDYDNLPKLNCEADAKAMAKIAEETLGFETTILTGNQDRDALGKALAELRSKNSLGADVLFYFAGQGIRADSQEWLVPTEASTNGISNYQNNLVSLRTLTCDNSHHLAILYAGELVSLESGPGSLFFQSFQNHFSDSIGIASLATKIHQDLKDKSNPILTLQGSGDIPLQGTNSGSMLVIWDSCRTPVKDIETKTR